MPVPVARSQLKTPWKNGTTHAEFEPVEFIAELAALIQPPRAHLTRFPSVFALNANLRAAADAIPPRQTCSLRTRSRLGLTATVAAREKAPRDDPGSSPGQALNAAPQAQRACTVVARCGAWPASNNPPQSAPSSPTSKSTARWTKRTTGQQSAHRPLWPRDTPPAAPPKEKPGRQHEAATNPQGRARLAAGNRRDIAANGRVARPAMPKSDSRTSDPRPNR